MMMHCVLAELDQRQRSVLPKHDEVPAGFPHLHSNICSSGGHHQHQVPRDWRAAAEKGHFAGQPQPNIGVMP